MQLRISTGREIIKYFRKQYEVDNIQYRRHDDGFSFVEVDIVHGQRTRRRKLNRVHLQIVILRKEQTTQTVNILLKCRIAP